MAEKYASRSSPAHLTQAQYAKMMSSGAHLWEHMGDAPVLLLPCLKMTQPELPSTIPSEVRTAMDSSAP